MLFLNVKGKENLMIFRLWVMGIYVHVTHKINFKEKIVFKYYFRFQD